MMRREWMKIMAATLMVCATAAFAAEPAPATVLKGNPTSKVYHKPECRHYNAKGSTVLFKTEADAVKAGYKPCKQCAAPKQTVSTKQDEDGKKTAKSAQEAGQAPEKAEKTP